MVTSETVLSEHISKLIKTFYWYILEIFEIVAMWHIVSLSLGRTAYFMEELTGNTIHMVLFLLFSPDRCKCTERFEHTGCLAHIKLDESIFSCFSDTRSLHNHEFHLFVSIIKVIQFAIPTISPSHFFEYLSPSCDYSHIESHLEQI